MSRRIPTLRRMPTPMRTGDDETSRRCSKAERHADDRREPEHHQHVDSPHAKRGATSRRPEERPEAIARLE